VNGPGDTSDRDVGVGPWPGLWPDDPRYDPELLRDGDRRNVVDRYRYWTVEAVRADAHAYLRSLPSGSFDVVFFDPMFEKPKKSQPAFEMLRRFAEHAPLTPETLEEARRVARRWVVVKGSKYSDDLKKLGLEAEPGSRYTSMIWGRIPAASSG